MNKLIIGCGILTFALASCQSKQSQQQEETLAVEKAKQELRDSLELDSFRRVQTTQQEQTLPIATSDQGPAASQQAYSAEPEGNYEQSSTTAVSQPVETKKKGWSDAAKGTAIGAGVGAGVGALIDKDKRLRGAAIGAAIGGGGGYVIGRKSDKKSGRAQ